MQKKNTRTGKEIPFPILFLISKIYRNAWLTTELHLLIDGIE